MHAIRRAGPADAKALADLAEATFRATFAATNEARNMDLHCRDNYGEALQAAELADPGITTFVAEDRGRLIGYAQVRDGLAPGCVAADRPGEIMRLYVAADWHGQGIAPALMAACLAEIAARGADVAWLGVWERNPRAIAFYRKWGFAEVGAHTFVVGDDPQRDLVLCRPAGHHGDSTAPA
jgi:ribosomal protein S18 acetylase RimI-like enzyme